MTFIKSSAMKSVFALLIAFTVVIALAPIAHANWDDAGDGCYDCGWSGWDSGSDWSDWDTGSGWSDWDTGSDWSDWDTGSDWSGWDSGSDWSDWDSGSDWSDWDTGSGWSDWDTGSDWSDWDTGSDWSGWDSGSDWSDWDTSNDPFVKVGTISDDPFVKVSTIADDPYVKVGTVANDPYVKVGTVSRGYTVPGGYVSPGVSTVRGIATARQANVVNRASNVRNVSNVQNVRNVSNVSRVNQVNRVNQVVQQRAVAQPVAVARPVTIPVAIPQPIAIPRPYPVVIPQPTPVVGQSVACEMRAGMSGTHNVLYYNMTNNVTSALLRDSYGNTTPVAVGSGARNVHTYGGTYTMTVYGHNGVSAVCSASVTGTPVYTPTPTYPTATPQVTVAHTGTTHAYDYVNIASVPYTGPNDIAYVLTMLGVALASVMGFFALKGSAFAGFAGLVPAFAGRTPTVLHEEIVVHDSSEVADDTHEDLPEQVGETAAVHTLSLENGVNGPKLTFKA